MTYESYWNELDAMYCAAATTPWKNEGLTRHKLTNFRPSQKAGMFSTDSNFCFSTSVHESRERAVHFAGMSHSGHSALNQMTDSLRDVKSREDDEQ